jgi:hypothetical protein
MKTLLKTTTAIPAPVPSPGEASTPKYCTIEKWCDLSGMGRRSVYDALGRTDLVAIKVGSRTLIDVEAGLSWLRSRPPAVIRAPRPRQQVAA